MKRIELHHLSKPELVNLQTKAAEALAHLAVVHGRAQHYENRSPEDFAVAANKKMTMDFAFALTGSARLAHKIAEGEFNDKYPIAGNGFITAKGAIALAKTRFPKLVVRSTLHQIKAGKYTGYHTEHITVRAAFMQNPYAFGAPVPEGTSVNWNSDVAAYQAILRLVYSEMMRWQVNITSILAGVSPIAPLSDIGAAHDSLEWPLTFLKKAKKKYAMELTKEDREARANRRAESHKKRKSAWEAKNAKKLEDAHPDLRHMGGADDYKDIAQFLESPDETIFGLTVDGDRGTVFVNVPADKVHEALDIVSKAMKD